MRLFGFDDFILVNPYCRFLPVVLFQKRFNSLLPVHVQLKYFKMLPTASKRNGIQIHTSKTVVAITTRAGHYHLRYSSTTDYTLNKV